MLDLKYDAIIGLIGLTGLTNSDKIKINLKENKE